jgi:hypothetical protein
MSELNNGGWLFSLKHIFYFFLEWHGFQPCHKLLRENSILSQGIALWAAEKSCFVSGHDFSRAIND